MAADDLERLVHHAAGSRRDRSAAAAGTGRPGASRSQTARWTGLLRGLVAGGEQGLDLLVGPVERAGRPRLFLALAAQLQRGLDERFAPRVPSTGYPWGNLVVLGGSAAGARFQCLEDRANRERAY